MSADLLFARFRGRIYFWTFTFKKVHPDWYYPKAWYALQHSLGRFHQGFVQGLRVVEAHSEHGLHYHALIGQRLNVHIVRRIASRYGFGRVHVKRCDSGAAFYLAKYLTPRDKLFGPRRWGCIGGFKGVRKNSIRKESCYDRNMRKVCALGRVDTYAAHVVYRASQLYGEMSEWPRYMSRCIVRCCLTGRKEEKREAMKYLNTMRASGVMRWCERCEREVSYGIGMPMLCPWCGFELRPLSGPVRFVKVFGRHAWLRDTEGKLADRLLLPS